VSCLCKIFSSASFSFLTLTLPSNAADAAGEAVNQAAAGAGDIAQGGLQGAAGTAGQLPCVFSPTKMMKQR